MLNREQILAVMKRMEEGQSERSACNDEKVSRPQFRIGALREGMGPEYAKALEALAADQIEKVESVIEEMREKKIDWQIARVEIDARKWFASKFLPRRYGEKIDHTTNGKDIPCFLPSSIIEKNGLNSSDTSTGSDSTG